MAMKLLLSQNESTCIAMGATLFDIQQASGAILLLSGDSSVYPGTALQELRITGSAEAVVHAMGQAHTFILQQLGSLTADKLDLKPGSYAVRVVVPVKAARAIIGAGGGNIVQLRRETGVFVHIEETLVPNDRDPLAEQVVTLDGPYQGLSQALNIIVGQHMTSVANEDLTGVFSQWAANTFCGSHVDGLTDLFRGPRCKFYQLGTCKNGANCKFSHSDGGAGAGMGGAMGGMGAGGLGGGMGGMGGGMGGGAPAAGGALGGMGLQVFLGSGPRTCKFFLEGTCRNGTSCRFTHDVGGGMGGLGSFGKAAQMTLKFLLSSAECSCVLGAGGATINAITQETQAKLHLSSQTELYPGTDLQEMTVKGAGADKVLLAAQYAYAQIANQFGAITAGDQTVSPGQAKIRVVVPSLVVKAIIGKGGENIKQLRSQLGMYVHCVEAAIPPGQGIGTQTEQVVCMNGPVTCVSAALATISAFVTQAMPEPWFSSWAMTSNAGGIFPGFVLNLDHLKGKGKGDPMMGMMGMM